MTWRPKWSHVVIALAVIAALAIASPVFGLDKSIKKAIKKEVAKQISKAKGPPGPPGANGADATRLFAYIRDDGSSATANVEYGSGVTAVSDSAGDSDYTVTFNRSVVNCVVMAQAGFGEPGGSAVAGAFSSMVVLSTGNAAEVGVGFRTSAGNPTDTAFMITAFC